MDATQFRHPKEKTYYTISAAISILLHVCTAGLFYIIGLLCAVPLWISEQLFKASVFGHAVKLSEKQFPQLDEIVRKQIKELNIEREIEVFIYNGQGVINAFAIKLLSAKYVILMSSLVDLMLRRGAVAELEMVIGHELSHHALSHTSVMRNLFLMPSRFVPFLNLAYMRGCEYSADRVGFELTKNSKSAIRGLLSITLGSDALADQLDITAFVAQEKSVPAFFGFLSNMVATHPRMTKRVEELLPMWDAIPGSNAKVQQPVTAASYDESRFMPKT